MNVTSKTQSFDSNRTELWAPPRRVSKERLRIRLYAAMMVADALTLVVAFLLTDLVRAIPLNQADGLRVLTLLTPIYFTAGMNNRTYSAEVLANPRLGLKRAVVSLLFAMAAVLFVAFSLHTSQSFSRLSLGVGFAVALTLLCAQRLVLSGIIERICDGGPLSSLIILDDAEDVDLTEAKGVHIVNARTIGLEPDVTSPVMMDRLGWLVQHIDHVLVACPPERRAGWAMALKGTNVRADILSPELASLGVLGTGSGLGHVTLQVSTESLELQGRALKRLLDLTSACIGLFLLMPLMLVIALAIRIEDGGPVFFKQQRLGRGNRLFAMYKFRSMRTQACDANGIRSASRDDDRITRVGKIIRSSSIDELPQLLNILKGDMSMVGPRPHALGSLAGDQLFWEIDTRYWHRHASKPGLTGLAQVRGFRGATHNRVDLVNRLQADLEYQRNWTIMRDISIILATFRVVVHRNAF